jgi:hypothetical protein
LCHLVLYTASGRFNFLPGSGAHLHAAYGNALCGITVRKELGRTLSFADQSGFGQSLFRHLCSLWQLGKIVESDDLILCTKDIRETALWYASRKRHLAALEMRLAAAGAVVARARLDALVSLPRGLAGARARTTPKSLAIPMRPGSWNQVVKTYFDGALYFGGARLTCCLGCHCLFLYRRHLDEMTHVLDLSA